MAARLAFARLTRAIRGGPSGPLPLATDGGLGTQGAAAASSSSSAPVAGDPTTEFGFLCFANVGKPYPKPWVELYRLLRPALEAAVSAVEEQLLAPQPPSAAAGAAAASPQAGQQQQPEQQQQRAAALRAELARLDLDWFVSVLARLHINVFRVGCVVMPGADGGGSGGGRPWAGGAGPATSGSAAYLVASLFNHSCEPNVEVVFRRNDSTAAFVAARDIDQGEQLFVSYIDEGQPLQARQQQLHFAYGFKCMCQRCVEEEEDTRLS